MHQHPRPAPRSASSASNPSTNPERTNNAREGPPQRTRSSVDLASYTERAGGQAGSEQPSRSDGSAAVASQDREMTKLNQIIQHFFTKAALTICGARANLPQVHTRSGDIKQDRWFNIVLDDTDVLLDSLQEWKRPDLSDNRPPPLVIEIYVDTASLSPNQALVAVDEDGKRWDVSEALAGGSVGSSPRPSNKSGGRSCEVVLERWVIELGDREDGAPGEQDDALPNVYKKGVVLFRSLYTFLRLLPAWKLYRRLGRQPGGGNGGLRLKYRVRQGKRTGSASEESEDALFKPLFPSETIAKHSNYSSTTASSDSYSYDDRADEHLRPPLPDRPLPSPLRPLVLPSGYLRIRHHHRAHLQLSVVEAEALISSRFLHHDESIPTPQGIGSLPTARSHRRESPQVHQREPRALLGAYGSLNTFHATGKRESPLSALQHRSSSSQDEEQYIMDRQYDLTGTGKPPLQRGSTTRDGKSVFKAGSLGSSPRSNQVPIASSPMEQAKTHRDDVRATGTSSQSSKRQSLNTLPQQALRVPPASLPNETAIASSGSSSPMAPPLVPRYSSAFGNRTKRTSSTSQPGQAADSGGSSSRASGSGNISDEGDIAAFINLVESDGVKNFTTKPSNSVNLAKYREYAPSVRSRLSTQSITEETEAAPAQQRPDEEEEEEEEPFIFHTDV